MNDRRSLDSVFKTIERLSAIGVVLTSLEMLTRAKALSDMSLMSWPVSRLYPGQGITFWESVFPVVLVLPRPLADLFVWSGAFFHLGIAGAMGLNDFLWAFVATYPAILFCSDETQSVLGKFLEKFPQVKERSRAISDPSSKMGIHWRNKE